LLSCWGEERCGAGSAADAVADAVADAGADAGADAECRCRWSSGQMPHTAASCTTSHTLPGPCMLHSASLAAGAEALHGLFVCGDALSSLCAFSQRSTALRRHPSPHLDYCSASCGQCTACMHLTRPAAARRQRGRAGPPAAPALHLCTWPHLLPQPARGR
jgi:hypothetical protein